MKLFRRPRVALAAASVAALTAGLLAAAAPATATPSGPVMPAKKDPIAGQYVVVLNSDVPDPAAVAKRLTGGGKLLRTYSSALKGFAVKTNAKEAQRIASDPLVSSVQQDSLVRATVDPADVGAEFTQAVPAPPDTFWGLNRIDQRTLPPNAAGNYNYFYVGSAVTAYVIDTGINYSHTQFGGRATLGADFVGDGFSPPGGDCYGHGTHVAGTIGGSTYGVAKSVKLKSVRVLDCSGSAPWSTLIAGLDWVAANAVKPAVVNMSLGGGMTIAANIATNNVIEKGITVAVAAGNSADDACNYSPASTLAAITVGATGDRFNPSAPITDARSDYSNYGACLDLFAPGSLIKSAYIGSNTAVATFSGTSMATPHVAGVAALYLVKDPGALPATVRNGIVDFATNGVVTNPGPDSPNRLLYAGDKGTLTLDATPEPISCGGNVTTKGTLSVGGKALSGKTVEVWFDPTGAPPPVKRGTATTSSTGAYTRMQTQSSDGSWYAVFAGSPLVGSTQSSLDFVDSNC